MLSVSSPLYDINKTFEENFSNPSFLSIKKLPIRFWPDKADWASLLGYPLASKVGAAACAVTTGKGIALLAQLGFDILTYKTIRRQAYPTHPLPNIVHVEASKLFDYSDLQTAIYTKNNTEKVSRIAISNSFGNGCLEPIMIMQDIAFAKNALVEGQVLIVSVYGEGDSLSEMSQDFAAAALMAKEAGADIIELNFSCPNLMKSGEPLYWSIEYVSQITRCVVKCMGDIPVLLKLGLLHEQESPLKLLISSARAGARGISAINSISMHVLNQKHDPAFGKRIHSGVSGYPIRRLALQSVKKLVQINQSEKLNLAILGMGGITLSEHFNEFLNSGVEAALSAAGMMWNPYLAAQFHQQSRS